MNSKNEVQAKSRAEQEEAGMKSSLVKIHHKDEGFTFLQIEKKDTSV